jgi:hypothetical protein
VSIPFDTNPRVTHIENTIIDLITQPLREKIREAGSQIHDALIDGAIHSATQTIRSLSVWFKELIWKLYLTSLLQCKIFLLWLRSLSKIMKKLKNYFVSNESRMQYATNREKNLPIGSGVIESAIRRVINMRVKSPGSFWKLDFSETVIYLKAQLLYGRWENLTVNWTKPFIRDFRVITMTASITAKST